MTSSLRTSCSSSDFKNFDSFHFFYFSRKENQTFFLLSSQRQQQFSHISGELGQHDAGILFSAGRKIIDISSGLLVKQNLELFKEDSMYPVVRREMLQLCRPNLSMPTLMNSKIYQQFVEETFETMIPYQTEDSNSAYYFVEVPYIDTEKFNQFCSENSLNLQISYAPLSEILSEEKISAETKILFDDENLKEFVIKYIIEQQEVAIKARYGVLCIMTTATNYRTMGIIGSCFKKHDESWKIYRFPLEEPTEEELLSFDGLFIPGASVCAADTSLPWRERFLDILRKVYNENTKCRILGTCFGIQILAEAFEGKTARMEEAVVGSSNVDISDDFWELPYVKNLNLENRNRLTLPKSHFDAVVEPPKGAKVYGTSECSNVEIMTMGDRCLAFQGHPEINEAWMACLIYQANKEKKNFKAYFEEAQRKYFSDKLEHEMWLKIIYNFFKFDKTNSSCSRC